MKTISIQAILKGIQLTLKITGLTILTLWAGYAVYTIVNLFNQM